MGKLTKALGVSTAVVSMAGVLAGCGGGSSGNGKVTLNFWYLWTGPEAKALEQVISDFNNSQDKIVVKGLSVPDQQKQIAAMSAGSGFDISDAFNTNVASWAAKGVVEPLDDYMKKSNYDTSDFIDAAYKTGQYQGKTYSLPIAMHDIQLLYNKDLFAKAGIQEPPKTTEDLLADMQKLTVVKNGEIQQLGLATYDYTTMAWVFGGDWTDGQGNPTPTNPGVLKAYHFYVDNVIKKYGAQQIQKFESGFGQYASPQNPFYVGKVAMTMDGEWQAQFIKEYAPNLHWGAGPLPYPSDNPQAANTDQVTTSVFFIPKNSKHKEEAWTFLQYLESPAEMKKFTHALANLPTRKSLINDSSYNDLDIKPWLQQLNSPNLHILPQVPWLSQYTNDIATQTTDIALLKETPEQGMQKVLDASKNYPK